MDRHWRKDARGIVPFIVVFIAVFIVGFLSFVPVRKAQAVVSHGTWWTKVELTETRTESTYECHVDRQGRRRCGWEESSSQTVVLNKRELSGDWSNPIAWPEPFETRFGQRNRRTGVFTIVFQAEGVSRYGQVSEGAFGRYYLGMPCTIWLNIYGSVVRDACGASIGR